MTEVRPTRDLTTEEAKELGKEIITMLEGISQDKAAFIVTNILDHFDCPNIIWTDSTIREEVEERFSNEQNIAEAIAHAREALWMEDENLLPGFQCIRAALGEFKPRYPEE